MAPRDHLSHSICTSSSTKVKGLGAQQRRLTCLQISNVCRDHVSMIAVDHHYQRMQETMFSMRGAKSPEEGMRR